MRCARGMGMRVWIVRLRMLFSGGIVLKGGHRGRWLYERNMDEADAGPMSDGRLQCAT